LNKFQIKSNIIAAIDKLINPELDEETVQKVMEPLYAEKCSDFMAQFLITELFLTQDGVRMDVVMFLINELIPKDVLEKNVFELLNSELDDEKKYRLINLLRSHGKVLNYEMFSQYMVEPEKFINEDTKIFLKNSETNPELKIDFIDFINAIDPEDRDTILDSLSDDYGAQESAEFIVPLLFCTPDKKYLIKLLELLSKTKSRRALDAITQIAPMYEDDAELKQLIKKSINMLKLSSGSGTVKIKGNTEYMYKCFISIPDGEDNFGIIVSKKRKDDTIQMFSAAINLRTGILDCFGFNEILKADFAHIVKRFYQEEKKAEILPEVAKMLLDEAEEKNIRTKSLMVYEYVCWKEIINNITAKDRESVFKYDDMYTLQLNDDFIQNLFDIAPFLKTWFYNQGNTVFDVIFDDFFKQYKNEKKLTQEQLDEVSKQAYSTFIKEGGEETFNQRLLLSAYLYKTTSNTIAASILYNIYANKQYKEEFLKYILLKSFYFRLKNMKALQKQQQQKTGSNVLVLNVRTDSESLDLKFLNSAIKLLSGSLSKYE